MILIETSAWVEFIRDTNSAVCNLVDDILNDDAATCDAVWMEVLAGARNERHRHDMRRLLARTVTLATLPTDYEHAAFIYRSCRRHGETPRSLIDCLIAAVAIRMDAAVLHADRDFDMIAHHSSLQTIPPSRYQGN
ncbi:MAG: PIN domain nuclease [Acidimicrobiaceae bacterium]|nr:PIN domain nuclease [Acidimicrobiaceae bacterium]